jgi:AcrR family transcriptional regulator
VVVSRQSSTRRSPTSRRRGAALEHAILQAAADECLEHGYEGLTMDRIAARARTNKPAIYRRWPSRAAVAVAAYRQMAQRSPPPPDTGVLRDDVLELLRRANRMWASPLGRMQRSLVAGIRADSQLMAIVQERANDAGSDLWLRVLSRAVARGEARPEALTPRIATVAVVLLRNEYVTRSTQTVPDDVLVAIVDEVYVPLVRALSPAEPGARRSQRRRTR